MVALLSDCADLLFLDVLLFRSCRSDKLPFCGFKSSFSRIILCFDLRNIVGTFSAPPPALLSGIFSGKCLPKLPVACCNFKTSLTLEVITIKTREQFLRILQPLVAILDTGAPKENIVQNHIKHRLFNVFLLVLKR